MQAQARRRPSAMQGGDEVSIDLDGIDAGNRIEQVLREGAQAWPDLDHMIPGAHGNGTDNGGQDTLVHQEVLTESLAGLMFQISGLGVRSTLIKADLHKGTIARQ